MRRSHRVGYGIPDDWQNSPWLKTDPRTGVQYYAPPGMRPQRITPTPYKYGYQATGSMLGGIFKNLAGGNTPTMPGPAAVPAAPPPSSAMSTGPTTPSGYVRRGDAYVDPNAAPRPINRGPSPSPYPDSVDEVFYFERVPGKPQMAPIPEYLMGPPGEYSAYRESLAKQGRLGFGFVDPYGNIHNVVQPTMSNPGISPAPAIVRDLGPLPPEPEPKAGSEEAPGYGRTLLSPPRGTSGYQEDGSETMNWRDEFDSLSDKEKSSFRELFMQFIRGRNRGRR